MTFQRRRAGEEVIIYGRHAQRDRRGNIQYVPDLSKPAYSGRAYLEPDSDRLQRAEIPGQQEIVMYTMSLPDNPSINEEIIGLWGYVRWNGYIWDIAGPPGFFKGVNRHTRHWEISIRRRPRIEGEVVPDNG